MTTIPRWAAIAIWVAVVAGLSVALARIAVWLQAAHFAAVGVFPAMFGAAIGLILIWIAGRFGIRSRAIIIFGAMSAAVMLAAAEHGFFYLDYRNQFATAIQNNPKAQLVVSLTADQFEPATFSGFMAAEAPAKWLLWILDAAAMIGVAALVAWLVAPGARSNVAAEPQAI
jgi:hypothetical protein